MSLAFILLPTVLWPLGYPDQALQRQEESLHFARTLASPFRLVVAQQWAALVHVARREPDAAQELAEAVIAQATEYGFAQWVALGTTIRGWALTAKGQIHAGIIQLQQGLADLKTTGSAYSYAGRLIWLALTLRALVQLVQAEIVYQRGTPPQATYLFKHALIQDVAYQSLLHSTQRQYHQQIAEVLTTQFLETVETQPELVAHHYTAAVLTESAIASWQHAGEKAATRYANLEAISHLRKGLELLSTLPPAPAAPEHATAPARPTPSLTEAAHR